MKKKKISVFLEKKVIKLLFLGFSSGLPILLVFSTLSVWLHKAGISRSTVTLFSWAGFAYAFKYLWSPLVDNFKIPLFEKLGHRRSWLLFSQIMILFSLIATALTDPSINIYLTGAAITFLAIFSATQDIVIDAYRIESAPQNYQGPLSSMYIAGYRLAMLVGGAGSLWLAAYFGVETYNQSVWMIVYIVMGSFMFIGILTTLLSSEPKIKRDLLDKGKNHTRFLLVILFSVISFIFLYSKIENPFETEEVIIGTDLGVWKTTNFLSSASPTWSQSYNGMTDVRVNDLQYRGASASDNRVVASTYGEGIYIGTFKATADVISPTVTLSQNHPDLIVSDYDTVRITATFDEAMASSPTISISSGLATNTAMTSSTTSVWYYDWNVPDGIDLSFAATATVSGTDLAGNGYSGTDSITFTVDNTPSKIYSVSVNTSNTLASYFIRFNGALIFKS